MIVAALVATLAAGAAQAGKLSDRVRASVEQFVQARTENPASEVVVPHLGSFEAPGFRSESVEIRLSANPRESFVGNVPVAVSLHAAGREVRRGVVTARVRAPGTVLVATRSIRRGQRIVASDVREEQRDQSGLTRGAVRFRRDVVGKAATRSIRAGAVVRDSWVAVPLVVKRGQLVALRYERGGLQIDGRGKAREDGRPGDPIRVLILSSRREVNGRVGSDGIVHVDF